MSPHSHNGFLIGLLAAASGLAAVVIALAGAQPQPVAPSPIVHRIVSKSPTPAPFVRQPHGLPSPNEVSLLFVGDVMLSRNVAVQMKTNGVDYPFAKTTAFLHSADITFGNLETPIIDGPPVPDGSMVFRSDDVSGPVLKRAGFTILSLANNHTPNQGRAGLKSTMDVLDAAGIKHVGAGMDDTQAYAPVYVQAKGKTFAFLAYNDPDVVPVSYGAKPGHAGTAIMDRARMKADIAEAKTKADFVIVSMHSGVEYTNHADLSQISYAHAAIDDGADLVIGGHPHVVQPAEIYKGKYIFYSVGNFVFDQDWSQETKHGLTIEAVFNNTGPSRFILQPVEIDQSQPQLMDVTDAQAVLTRLQLPLQQTDADAFDTNDQAEPLRWPVIEVQSEKPALSKILTADLDGNGQPETYALNNGTLTVTENDHQVWQSPPAWWVDDLAIADADNDGIADLSLLVWKPEPTPSGQEVADHQQLLLFDFQAGTLQPVWESPDFAQPDCALRFDDVDASGKNELVTLQGMSSGPAPCATTSAAVWKWKEGGFANVWRGPSGSYGDFFWSADDAGSRLFLFPSSF